MNKITLRIFLIGSIALTGLSSCKKNYTCTCTTTSGTTYDSEIKTTKKKAKAFCADQETSTRSCTLN